jgi:hypothetical protein
VNAAQQKSITLKGETIDAWREREILP